MKTIAEHLEIFEGDLYDNRKPWGPDPKKAENIIRHKYQWHFSRIQNLSQVKATIRAGEHTWPGCYQLYFITDDCQPLCFDCAKKEFRQVVWDFLHKAKTGWRIQACEINYEDSEMTCCHCNKPIPASYA